MKSDLILISFIELPPVETFDAEDVFQLGRQFKDRTLARVSPSFQDTFGQTRESKLGNVRFANFVLIADRLDTSVAEELGETKSGEIRPRARHLARVTQIMDLATSCGQRNVLYIESQKKVLNAVFWDIESGKLILFADPVGFHEWRAGTHFFVPWPESR